MQEELEADIDSESLIDELSFCVIDLETTGGHHLNDQIIEIGLVNVDGRKIVEEKGLLINPQRDIPDFIQKLTSIKNDDVKDAPIISDVIDEILDFIGDRIIVAHNTSFDVPFLNAVLRKLARPELTNKVLCTNVMTKHMIPEIMNSNLTYMCQLFDIKHSNAHRATADAKATAELLIIYLNIFIKKSIKKVNQLYYPRNKFELDRIHISELEGKDKVFDTALENPTSMTILLKGDRGLILGLLPLENPQIEKNILKEFLNSCEWKMATIILASPILEGLFQFNNHFMKYEPKSKELVLNYLQEKYGKHELTADDKIENLDFVIAPHLVKEQIIVYSFLNLNTNSKAIFKFPGHKKKMLQFLKSQINRFENNQKGRKRNLLQPEMLTLIEKYLASQKNKGLSNYFFLARKDVKDSGDQLTNHIDKFLHDNIATYNFPQKSL